MTFADLRVTQPSMQRSYLVPSYTTAKDGEDDALDVLALCPRRRLEQPALSRAGDGEAPRDQCRRLVSGHDRSMRPASAFTRTPAAGVPLEKVENAIDAVIATAARQGTERRRARARQEPHDRRLCLCAGQPVDAGAPVWRGADHRARPSRPCRTRPERLRAVTAEQVRDAARRYLDKRRSVTGYLVKDGAPREEKKFVIRLLRRGTRRTGVIASRLPRRAASKIEAIVSPGGIKAWLVREPSVPIDRARLRLRGRRQCRPGRQAGRRQHGGRHARRGRRRARCARLSGAAWRRSAIQLGFSRRARPFPRLAAHADDQSATRASNCCASR